MSDASSGRRAAIISQTHLSQGRGGYLQAGGQGPGRPWCCWERLGSLLMSLQETLVTGRQGTVATVEQPHRPLSISRILEDNPHTAKLFFYCIKLFCAAKRSA